MIGDVLRALDCAVTAIRQPSVRIFNVVGPDTNCGDPVSDVLRSCLGKRGDHLDLSRYDQPGHSYDSLYSMDGIKSALGFSPEQSTRSNIASDLNSEPAVT